MSSSTAVSPHKSPQRKVDHELQQIKMTFSKESHPAFF